jgi:hypothetical protein
MCHEFDGIAQTTEVHEIIDEIKEFYEIENSGRDEDVDKKHMLAVLRFLNRILNLDGIRNFDPEIDKMIRLLG